jgi:putative oxidoreductase
METTRTMANDFWQAAQISLRKHNLCANSSVLAESVYAAVRIVTGLMFSFHGVQKVFGLMWNPAYPRPPLTSQVGIGGVIELVTGLAIALGLFTRYAAFLASGTMAVAYWQFHVFGNAKVEGTARFIPALNDGSAAALYCFLFLYMACKGAGPWSVDCKWERDEGLTLR